MDHRHEEARVRPAPKRRAGRLMICLVPLALVLGACGSSSESGNEVASASNGSRTTTTKKTDARQAGLDFARCMREHGVDVPDPTFDDQGNAQIGFQVDGGDVELSDEPQAGFQEADKACRHHLAGVMGNGPDGRPDADMENKALEFARCMREHGVTNFPDPNFSESGMLEIGGEGFDPFSPTVREAQKACQSILGRPPSGGSGDAAPIGGR